MFGCLSVVHLPDTKNADTLGRLHKIFAIICPNFFCYQQLKLVKINLVLQVVLCKLAVQKLDMYTFIFILFTGLWSALYSTCELRACSIPLYPTCPLFITFSPGWAVAAEVWFADELALISLSMLCNLKKKRRVERD